MLLKTSKLLQARLVVEERNVAENVEENVAKALDLVLISVEIKLKKIELRLKNRT